MKSAAGGATHGDHWQLFRVDGLEQHDEALLRSRRQPDRDAEGEHAILAAFGSPGLDERHRECQWGLVWQAAVQSLGGAALEQRHDADNLPLHRAAQREQFGIVLLWGKMVRS